MRIFYVAQTTPNEIDLPGSKLWHINLYLPLQDLGHEVVPFSHPWLVDGYKCDLKRGADRAWMKENRPQFSEALVKAVREEHRRRPIQVFFSYFSSAHAEPEAIREIGRMGIVTINWYCNASYQFHNVAEIAPAYDCCLVPEKFRLKDYERAGARPMYCQEAANPNFYHPVDVPREFDVTFVGQKYGNRPVYLRRLIDAGIDARVWGPNWTAPAVRPPLWRRAGSLVKRMVLGGGPQPAPELPASHCGPPLDDDELIRMYSRSRISLGFTSVAEVGPDGAPPIKQVRLRDFEATMSGAFYLVEHFEELTEFFEPDKEIVFFGDETELVDKCRHYLAHPDECERIRAAALRRARAEHTWQRRFETVFRKLGLS